MRPLTFEMCKEVRFIDENDNKKKKEEKQKFVFKNAMKHLKKKVRKEQFTCKKVRKRLIEDCFYEKYFALAPVLVREVVDSFHKTSRDKTQFSFVPKNVNKNYFQSMFLVESFKTDFFEYLRTDFLDDYSRKIEKKIIAFVDSKIRKVVAEIAEKEEGVKLVCQQIKSNPKWKIPWTVKEAKIAVWEFQLEFKGENY